MNVKEGCHDEQCLCIFCVSYRYGENHPMFYIGCLEAASQEAFYGKARDVRMIMCEHFYFYLFIYFSKLEQNLVFFFALFPFNFNCTIYEAQTRTMLVHPLALI